MSAAAESQAVFLAAKFAVCDAVRCFSGAQVFQGSDVATVKVSLRRNDPGRLKITGAHACACTYKAAAGPVTPIGGVSRLLAGDDCVRTARCAMLSSRPKNTRTISAAVTDTGAPRPDDVKVQSSPTPKAYEIVV